MVLVPNNYRSYIDIDFYYNFSKNDRFWKYLSKNLWKSDKLIVVLSNSLLLVQFTFSSPILLDKFINKKRNRGKITIDRITFEINIPGVFAGWDVIEKGKNIAVTAIAQGREAAFSIDRYLLSKGRSERKGLFYEGPIKIPKKVPPQPLKEKPEDYWMNFSEIAQRLSKNQNISY